MTDDSDNIEGGLLDVLRSRGLKAAICAPMAGAEKREAAVSTNTGEPGSARCGAGVEFDESGEGVDMGAEIDDIKDCATKYAALEKKFQLNLGDPEQLKEAGLEDPALVLHTAARRQRLLDFAKEQEELPSEEFLDLEDIKARRALSLLVTTLEDLRTQIDCESCTLFGLSKTAPSPLDKKLKSSSTQLEELVGVVRQAQASLTVARRSSEAATDGMKRRATHFKLVLKEM